MIYAHLLAAERDDEDWRTVARDWLGLDPDTDEAGAEARWRDMLGKARAYWHGGPHPWGNDDKAMSLGTRIEETGTVARDGEGWFFRRDAGGRYRLETARVASPGDGARVLLTGVTIGEDLVDVLAFADAPGGI